MDERHSNLAGCSVEQSANFPDVLLYRCTSGDDADCLATLDRRTLIMSRPVAGLACRIRIPVRQFQAVALVVREKSHVIRLMHRDIGLSLDVEEFDSLTTAEEYRDRLASFLDLPPVLAAGTPSRDDEEIVTGPTRMRRGRAIRVRRPRFLARRAPGEKPARGKIEGREIIARN